MSRGVHWLILPTPIQLFPKIAAVNPNKQSANNVVFTWSAPSNFTFYNIIKLSGQISTILMLSQQKVPIFNKQSSKITLLLIGVAKPERKKLSISISSILPAFHSVS